MTEISHLFDSPVAHEPVHDLAPYHANVLVICKRLADVHLSVCRGDHFHLANLHTYNRSKFGESRQARHARNPDTRVTPKRPRNGKYVTLARMQEESTQTILH